MPVDIPRRNNFTLIRCSLASVVLVRHCMDSSLQACFVPVKAFFESQDAVCLFFVISGLLVTASCERSPSWQAYAGKRLRRIFPLYLTAVIGAALILCLASSLPAARYFTDSRFWKYLFWNSLTLNFMQRTLPGVFEGNPYNASVNDALWTVKIELFFYACLPLLCRIVQRLKGRWKQNGFLVFLYVLSFAYRLLCRKLASVLGIPVLNTLALEAPGYLGPFVLGMLCYYNFDRFSRFRSGLLPFCAFVLCLLLVIPANCGVTGRIPDGIKYILLAYACLYAAFSASFLHDSFQGPDCSYAVYLFHFPLLQWMIHCGLFAAAPWLSLYLCLASTFALALAATLAEKGLGAFFAGLLRKEANIATLVRVDYGS